MEPLRSKRVHLFQNLKNIDAYEYTVLLQNFIEEELMVLDSMVTEQEIDQ